MRARWYDPRRARFLSRDPAGYADGLSLYLYAKANPLLFFDPTGLAAVTWLEIALQVPGALVTHFNERREHLVAGAAGGALTGAAAGAAVGANAAGAGAIPGAATGAATR